MFFRLNLVEHFPDVYAKFGNFPEMNQQGFSECTINMLSQIRV